MGLKKLFDSGYKELKRCEKIAFKIEALEEEIQKLRYLSFASQKIYK